MVPLLKKGPLLSVFNNTLIKLPSASNLNYLWNLGSLLGLFLVVQIVTGVLLAMNYSPNTELAFQSVIHITRNVNYGWLLRIAHSNGASCFFMCAYVHIGKNIYYGTYLNFKMWVSGVLLFILMMATAFLGYVLPWGQMSFWGATVITNFFSAIPLVGNTIVVWLWGGFSVGQATLNRFYSLHFLLPFIIVVMVIIHLVILHEKGSSNPLGVGEIEDKTQFHPYYLIKDLYGGCMIFFVYLVLIFFFPYYLGDAENFILANSLVTPVHIVPEWYFLFAYAILRAVPNKLGGLIALVLSLVIVVFLPFFHTSNLKSLAFRPMGKIFFWVFIANFILLTWLGSKPVEEPYLTISIVSSLFYFFYFIVLVCVEGYLSRVVLTSRESTCPQLYIGPRW